MLARSEFWPSTCSSRGTCRLRPVRRLACSDIRILRCRCTTDTRCCNSCSYRTSSRSCQLLCEHEPRTTYTSNVVERVEEIDYESRNVVHVLLFSVLLLKQDSSKTSIIPHRFAVTDGSAAGAGHTDTLKIPSSVPLRYLKGCTD